MVEVHTTTTAVELVHRQEAIKVSLGQKVVWFDVSEILRCRVVPTASAENGIEKLALY